MLIRGDVPCPQFPVFRLRRHRRPPSVLPCLFPSTVHKAAVAALCGRTARRQASALCSACCAPPCSRSGPRFTSTAAAGTSTTPAPGREAVTPFPSPAWKTFFLSQDEGYDYRRFRGSGCNPWHGAGLDCSGYLGWVIYAALHRKSGLESYVYPSTEMAGALAARGLGRLVRPPCRFLPGDLFSMEGHIWLCVGVCRRRKPCHRAFQPDAEPQNRLSGRRRAAERHSGARQQTALRSARPRKALYVAVSRLESALRGCEPAAHSLYPCRARTRTAACSAGASSATPRVFGA